MRKQLLAGWLVFLIACPGWISAGQETSVTITILNTSDEHGWLEPFQTFGSSEIQGGAANIYSWWIEREGYDPATMLLLSGGDNWTGPAISTWFEGQPITEAMNIMGYRASAIGNHEFDFGREVMQQRFAEARFPYLAANIRNADDNTVPDFAQPYTIIDVQGVPIGIIGLTTTATATTTHPRNISDLVFTNYADALREFVPHMRDEGAEIIIALTHVCTMELQLIAREVPELVDAMFAGHCNERSTREVDGVAILGGGDAWRSYARLDLVYDPVADEILEMNPAVVEVQYGESAANPVTTDASLTELTQKWRSAVDEQLSEAIGYSANGVEQRSWAMANWVLDAWLWAYPTADIAMTNFGGFRAPIPAGAITWGDIVTMLPFDNTIVEVTLTGDQIRENLLCCRPAVAGLTYSVRGSELIITLAGGSEIDPNASYKVLVNDFMYFGGDDFRFQQQDPDGYFTGIQWRQPVIDYTASLMTDENNPLDDYLDSTQRRVTR